MEEKNFYDREDEHIEGIERFKALEGREKWSYFKSYYLWKTIILLVLIVAVIAGITDWAQARNDIDVYVAVVDDSLNDQTVMTGKNYVAFVGSEEYDISINIDHEYVAEDALLSVKIGVGGVDILIAKHEFHEAYPAGNYEDLEEVLPEEVWNKVKEYAMYSVDEEGNEYVYGIDLAECESYQSLEPTIEHPIITIPIDGNKKELAVEFINFLWED